MKKQYLAMAFGWFLASSCFFGKSKKVEKATEVVPPSSIYDITIKSLDESSEIKFSDFRGKKILVVNTASECGYTPQYKDLEILHQRYKEKLVVIGCPCNQFGGQEPGIADSIQSFCERNYGVTFLLTEKINVKGDSQHPLYKWFTSKKLNGAGDFEVKWNFNKFLISEEGKLLHYFGSGVKPLDEAITGQL